MNKKAQEFTITLIIVVLMISIVAILFMRGVVMKAYVKESVKISPTDGLEYASEIQTDDEQNLKLALINNLIFKIIVGIAIIIIAVALYKKFNKNEQTRQRKNKRSN